MSLDVVSGRSARRAREQSRSLDAQREQWERALSERPDRFGGQASDPARATADRLRRGGLMKVLELGAGQGRDTLYFAEQGFEVHALDYAASSVEAIQQKARQAALSARVAVSQHDVRNPLPYPDGSFDACYSHMLFCMALTQAELHALSQEILRVLRPGGLCVYTARTTDDPDFGRGVRHGEGLYQSGGFIVHFFSAQTVERLAGGYEIVEVERFMEGPLPRDLFRVTQRKRADAATGESFT
jgi:SAM-dependent methyltransferase